MKKVKVIKLNAVNYNWRIRTEIRQMTMNKQLINNGLGITEWCFNLMQKPEDVKVILGKSWSDFNLVSY